MTSNNKNFIDKLAAKCTENNQISQDLFEELDVKRGLRNKDGSGVLTGLTQISSVTGFKKTDKGVEPVEGVLRYRGVDVGDLIKGIHEDKQRFGFEEVTFLLLFGLLPTKQELDDFVQILNAERQLPEGFIESVIRPFQSRSIMNNLSKGVLALYGTDDDPDDISVAGLVRQALHIIPKFPLFTAYAYHSMKHQFGGEELFFHPPSPELSTAENFLAMMRPSGEYTELEATVLDVLLVLHADHGGGNNSTFTTRVVSSSNTDSYSAMAAAVGSLKGPLHGGANNSVMGMMADIQKNVKNWEDETELKKYLTTLLEKKAGDTSGKIYGFGHAVYTKSDPRAIAIKDYAINLAKQKNREKELNLYFFMEKIVPQVFTEFKGISKVISPNVDFFSIGFIPAPNMVILNKYRVK